MPDATRIVEFHESSNQPLLVLDLETFDGRIGRYYREADTFTYTPPSSNARMAAQPGPRGGQRMVGASYENGSVSASFRVGALNPEDAIDAANDLVATIDNYLSSSRQRYLEWRPVGAKRSTFFEVRGAGTWAPTWSARRFEQNYTLSIQATWPVAPYALDLPLDHTIEWRIPHDAKELGRNFVANYLPFDLVLTTGTNLTHTTSDPQNSYAMISTNPTLANNATAIMRWLPRMPGAIAGTVEPRQVRPGDVLRLSAQLKIVTGSYFNATNGRYGLGVALFNRDGVSVQTGNYQQLTFASAANFDAWQTLSTTYTVPDVGDPAYVVLELFASNTSGSSRIMTFRGSRALATLNTSPTTMIAFGGNDANATWGVAPYEGYRGTSILYDKDSLSQWTQHLTAGAGDVNNVASYANTDAPANGSVFISTPSLWRYDERGPYTDAEVTARFSAPSTLPGTLQTLNIAMKMPSDGNATAAPLPHALVFRAYMNTGQVDIGTFINGTFTSLVAASTAPTFTAGTVYHLRARIEGDACFVGLYSADPRTNVAPIASRTVTITNATDLQLFGAAASGQIGIQTENTALANLVTVHQIWIKPYTYAAKSLPGVIHLRNVPGDMPPKMGVEAEPSATPFQRPYFAMGWHPFIPSFPTGTPWAPFGPIDSSALTGTLGSWTDPSVGGTYGGTVKRLALPAAGGLSSLTVNISLNSLVPDEINGEAISSEVYALVKVPLTAINPRYVLKWESTSAATADATLEWGTSGRPLVYTDTQWRFTRLGTLQFPANKTGLTLTVTFEISCGAGSTGNLDVDYLFFLPAKTAATSRTGLAFDASYPSFLPTTTQITKKRVNHNLSTELAYFTSPDLWVPDNGLGGPPFEPDVTKNNGMTVTMLMGQNVPDNAITTGTEVSTTESNLRFNVWPRWRFGTKK
jgi:hypothetical protein